MTEGTATTIFARPRHPVLLAKSPVAGVAAAYLGHHFLAPLLPGSFLGPYVLRPVLWLALALFIGLFMPRQRPAAKLRLRGRLTEAAVAVAAAQVALAVVLGAVEGFGRSPYSFSPVGILVNLLYVGTTLWGTETSRAYLVNLLGQRRPALAAGLVALAYSLFLLPPARLAHLGPNPESVRFAATTLLPGVAESLFATVAAYFGGAMPALAYRGLLEAFRWFCPVLPDLSWATTAFLGTLAPAVGLSFLLRASSPRSSAQTPDDRDSPGGWIAVGAASVALIWFSLGLFKVFPAVVISGSMRPTFQVGDVAVVLKVRPENIREGEVICFRQGPLPTLHRAIRIEDRSGRRLFFTKGDANPRPDPQPVGAEQVGGKVVGRIPMVGWVSILLRGAIGDRLSPALNRCEVVHR